MSGGHFDYSQYHIRGIAEELEDIISFIESDGEGKDWLKGYKPETLKRFKEAVPILKAAYIYAQRIDWLLSADDGEDQFHKRLETQLKELEASKNAV